jgi:cytochrome c5
MKSRLAITLGLLLLGCSLRIFAQPQSPAPSGKLAKATTNRRADNNDGEQRFQANCGRCHHAPESISPREAKAVLQHMRVRAMLSSEDERLILKYLAP